MIRNITCQDAFSDMGKTKTGVLHYKLSLVIVYGALTEKHLWLLCKQILDGYCCQRSGVYSSWVGKLFRGYSPLLDIGHNSSVGIAQVGIGIG